MTNKQLQSMVDQNGEYCPVALEPLRSGGLLLTAIVGNDYCKRQYFSYSRREAIAEFCEEFGLRPDSAVERTDRT